VAIKLFKKTGADAMEIPIEARPNKIKQGYFMLEELGQLGLTISPDGALLESDLKKILPSLNPIHFVVTRFKMNSGTDSTSGARDGEREG
jgi:hypothetical protein